MLPIIDPILHELRTLAQMYQSATPITSLDHQHASPAKDSDDNIRSTSQTSRTASLPRVEPVSDTAMPMAAQPLALATLNLIEDGRPLTSALTKKSAFKKSGKKQKMRKLRAYSHHTQYGLFILKTNLLIAASTQYTTTLNRKKSAMLPASSHIASVAPSGETVSIILAPSRPAQPISMSSRSCSTRCLRTTQIGWRLTFRIITSVLHYFDPSILKLVRNLYPTRPSKLTASRSISVMEQSSSKWQKAFADCHIVACWHSSV